MTTILPTSASAQTGDRVKVTIVDCEIYHVGSNVDLTGGSPFSLKSGTEVIPLYSQLASDGTLRTKIEYNGQQGWVSNSHLSFFYIGVAGYYTAYVNEKLNAGYNVDLKGGSPFTIPANAKITVQYEQQTLEGVTRCYVEYNGQLGWVSKSRIRLSK